MRICLYLRHNRQYDKREKYKHFLIDEVVNKSNYSEPITHALVHLRDILTKDDLGQVKSASSRLSITHADRKMPAIIMTSILQQNFLMKFPAFSLYLFYHFYAIPITLVYVKLMISSFGFFVCSTLIACNTGPSPL